MRYLIGLLMTAAYCSSSDFSLTFYEGDLVTGTTTPKMKCIQGDCGYHKMVYMVQCNCDDKLHCRCDSKCNDQVKVGKTYVIKEGTYHRLEYSLHLQERHIVVTKQPNHLGDLVASGVSLAKKALLAFLMSFSLWAYFHEFILPLIAAVI
jgi:hypothetical protein